MYIFIYIYIHTSIHKHTHILIYTLTISFMYRSMSLRPAPSHIIPTRRAWITCSCPHIHVFTHTSAHTYIDIYLDDERHVSQHVPASCSITYHSEEEGLNHMLMSSRLLAFFVQIRLHHFVVLTGFLQHFLQLFEVAAPHLCVCVCVCVCV